MKKRVGLQLLGLAGLGLLLALLLGPRPLAAQNGTNGRTLPEPQRVSLSPDVTLRGGQAAGLGAAPIRLQAGTFVPGPNAPGTLDAAARDDGRDRYYLVQFSGPVQAAWKTAVTAAGGELLGYVPDYAFKVRMSAAEAAQIAAQPQVTWVGDFLPRYRRGAGEPAAATTLYRVVVENGANAAAARAAIAATGAQIGSQDGPLLLVAADGAQVAGITAVADVAWLEPYSLPQKHNDEGGGAIIGGAAAHTYGFDGSTQIVAVSDTGLGGGTPATAHADIPAARIVSILNMPDPANICFQSVTDDGAIDVDSGHGTHTAVSVLGDGGPNGEGRGVVPAAQLVFQATENWAQIRNFCGGGARYALTGLPDDLADLYQPAYDLGARVHSNSWGSAQAGAYTTDSANTDAFTWDNPDMLITFSAGNAGVDGNDDGVVDDDSIGSPATAKNVLTVGASEGARADNFPCDPTLTYTSSDAYQVDETCATMGGENILGTAGDRWDFTAEPLNSDATAGNAQQMAPFSSRGPTNDGRLKPDLVAPGTWILSGFSPLYQEQYDDAENPQNNAFQWDGYGMPYNENYKYMGGTSMSNPLAAGAAAVVRDYYQKVHSFGASAALTKATLVNSAVDLLDENNDGANDNDFPIPNVHEGWGLINLRAATDASHAFDDMGTIETGSGAVYAALPVSGAGPLKVTLVWSDYPGTTAAAGALVNSLLLLVEGPNGETFYGNDFSGGWSQQGTTGDGINNVQNVFVQNPAAGDWQVTVIGYNVPQGPQPYALVFDDVGLAPGRVDVSGTIGLQGRPASTAAQVVTLTDNGGAFPPVVAGYDPATGAFEAPGLLTAPGGGSTYHFRAEHPLFLAAGRDQLLDGTLTAVPYSAPAVTLLGGNANNDNKVDVADLSCIGAYYNTGPVPLVGPCANNGSSDVNEDGDTDIGDLSLAGGNYGLFAERPW